MTLFYCLRLDVTLGGRLVAALSDANIPRLGATLKVLESIPAVRMVDVLFFPSLFFFLRSLPGVFYE